MKKFFKVIKEQWPLFADHWSLATGFRSDRISNGQFRKIFPYGNVHKNSELIYIGDLISQLKEEKWGSGKQEPSLTNTGPYYFVIIAHNSNWLDVVHRFYLCSSLSLFLFLNLFLQPLLHSFDLCISVYVRLSIYLFNFIACLFNAFLLFFFTYVCWISIEDERQHQQINKIRTNQIVDILCYFCRLSLIPI